MRLSLVFTTLIAVAAAAPSALRSREAASYKTYKGDGSTAAGWPSAKSWVKTFDEMWNANLNIIQQSCQAFSVPLNSKTEIAQLKAAIISTAEKTKVDSRFILAIVLQESQGCVRVWSTANGIHNPGLMQSMNGKHTCNDGEGKVGNVQNPCPKSEIEGMITDGVGGTSTMSDGSDGGLSQHLKTSGWKAGATNHAESYYVAARKYNAGPNSDIKNLGGPGATPSYASDVTNRLCGVAFTKSGYQA